MSSRKRLKDVYPVATKTVSTAVDFCANGCVNLHFGATVVHLPPEDFLVFQEVLQRVAGDMRKELGLLLSYKQPSGEYH